MITAKRREQNVAEQSDAHGAAVARAIAVERQLPPPGDRRRYPGFQMKFSIRTLMLITLATCVIMAIWQRYDSHRRLWQEYTSGSLPKSAWMHESRFYRFAVKHSGFTYLDETDPNYVDFRYWSDNRGCAKFWTLWRLPYTESALVEHVNHLKLQKCELSASMIEALVANMPSDWGFKHDRQFIVYQPKGQNEISYFCRLLLYDRESGIIYFYDMDQEIPA